MHAHDIPATQTIKKERMETLLEMHRRGDTAGIWKRYCGFVDLTIEEFMASQNRLLEEQLRNWQRSTLVKRIFGGTIPSTVQEFRERAPLTTYEDYTDVLLNKKESELTEKTFIWVHTSGKSGVYEFKWIPYTSAMYETVSDSSIALFILGSCRKHGEIRLKERDRLMYTVAQLPYVSGLLIRALHEQFNFRIWPSYEAALKMDFFERIREAIRLAYSEGIDYFFGITSVMINISEQLENFGKSGRSAEARKMLRQPKVLFRILKGLLKAKVRGGPLRPADLWKVKGIMCSGMDSSIYRERIRAMWGSYPRELYGCTELGMVGFQHFAGSGLVMRDTSSYVEFLELDDYQRWSEDRSYRPKLRTLSEVEAGKEYAVVGTNFHGGVLVRYVVGDSVTILSLSDDRIGLRLPQMLISSRIDDVIDIAGFTRLTEKTIWSAVEASGIPYVDWVVAKEHRGENPVLHLYIELKRDGHDAVQVQARIHEQLRKADQHYQDLEEMAGIKPLVVTLLSHGTFARYLQERVAAGADIAHSKPVHMNPKGDVLARLLSMSSLKI
jgi:hypothetical protein